MYVPFRVAFISCSGILALCQSSQSSGDPPGVAPEEPTKAYNGCCVEGHWLCCAGHPCFAHLKSNPPDSDMCQEVRSRPESRGVAHKRAGLRPRQAPNLEKLQNCILEESLCSSLLFDTPLSCCIVLRFFWYMVGTHGSHSADERTGGSGCFCQAQEGKYLSMAY